MKSLVALRPRQHAEWTDVLAQSVQHDFYHLPAYHALAEESGEGEAHLFVYQDGDNVLALPLLLRPIGEVSCHAQIGRGWWDAHCVYGYAGPVSAQEDVPDKVLRDFREALRESLQERKVVTVFSRLDPLLPQQSLLSGLGDYVPTGTTVSIDLTLPVEVQRARYRKDYKRQINRLRRLGVTCVCDSDLAHLGEFIEIYHETMRRVQAGEGYFFDRAYFERLLSMPGMDAQLFVCSLENEVICGGVFVLCDRIVQAHLVGTRSAHIELSPAKLLFDTVRLWANEQGARVFHLGGGVGAQEDSLFHFKAGFSDQRHEFAVWKWVILAEIHDRLCQEKRHWGAKHNSDRVLAEYFPGYRCPKCPCLSER